MSPSIGLIGQPVTAQLSHHHPCGRLNRLSPEEGISAQTVPIRRTRFVPLFPWLPAKTKRCISQRQKIPSVTAVNRDQTLHPSLLPIHFHTQGCDQRVSTLNFQQAAARPPEQPGFLIHPALQDGLRCGWSVAETADPVVIETFRLALFQFAQESSPQSCLPGADFVAVRAADTSSTHHSAQP